MVKMIRLFFVFCIVNGGIGNSVELSDVYEKNCSDPCDINEHLPALRKLAAECSTVTEIGIREIVSTWGILQGLSESKGEHRSYIGIDLNYPELNQLFLADQLAESNGVSFHFWQANDFHIDIEPTDMLFIDSWHTYCHLTYELEKFSPKVRKYIAMHDTSEPWGDEDEPFYQGIIPEYPAHINRVKRGLWPAVDDFLKSHPEWRLKKRYLNNHGFTILERAVPLN
ncbi:MAG: hypothetical protein V4487_05515 [Chlamydiota bacterium]